ncbi:hypothetical protein GEMRC1_009676 [Eukaryota sp. GEM-RC1]
MTIPFYNEGTTCKKAPRNLNPTKLRIANEIFDDLIEDGFAEETSTESKFSSPIVLVIYPDDYSGTGGVNASTKSIEAHLPKISDVSIFLSNANFICTLDLPKAFWQVPLDRADYQKTTLSIPGRSIFFKRAAFGLKNVPAFFQNLMQDIFSMPNVFIYMDDVIIAACTEEELLSTLNAILTKAAEHRVRFALRKCAFLTSESAIKILGAIFHKKKRSIDPDRVKCIIKLPIPSTIGELRSFNGSINYIRDWIPHLSNCLQPLTALTKKDESDRRSVKSKWTSSHTNCFPNHQESNL